MPLYSEMGMGIRSDYLEFLKIHWRVSAQDALMVLTVYILVAILWRNFYWPKLSSVFPWSLFIVLLPLWQAAVEYHAVYLAYRWAYAESMPLIFGIGLSPILQMLILPSLVVVLSRNIIVLR